MMAEILQLMTHNSYLAGGFAVNLLIAVVSMGAGTVLGGVLGMIRSRRVPGLTRIAGFATNICRNVPSFVLLFYMAFMIPSEIDFLGQIWSIPLWIKATVALTFPVIGFTSDQSLGYFVQHRSQVSGATEVFAVAWMQYFLIIIMASATASVIGADEIVGRANILIGEQESARSLLIIYGYVSLWFLVTGIVFSAASRLIVRAFPEAV